MAEEKQSFVLYKSWNGAVELMSDESAGRLFKAIMCYAAKGTIPQIGADIVPLFGMMRSQFDIDNNKYAAKCAKLSNNGKKGAEAKKQKQAIANNCKQNEANTSLYDMSCNDMRCNDMSCNDYDNSVCSPTRTHEENDFIVPSAEEVQAYCVERNNGINAEHFVNYYTERKWQGVNDWKARIRSWETNGIDDKKQNTSATSATTKSGPATAPQSFDIDKVWEKALERTYGK